MKPETTIYLDYAATTPMDPQVAARMSEFLTIDGIFGNPASSHAAGRKARQAVEQARAQVAAVVGATSPMEIIWTSGATESDNLAIIGAAHFYADERGRHIITSRTEHKAVLDCCHSLEQEGFEVTYLVPDKEGILDPESVADAVRDDTVLVSIMHVNNETGVEQDITAIGEKVRAKGALFHVDAAQSLGKLPIDLQTLPVDMMSFSGHKIYGPKGIGALYVRRKPSLVHLKPLIHGGGHEMGLRSGTLATHQIVAMAEACHIAAELMESEESRLAELRDQLWQGLSDLDGVLLNGHPLQRVPGILNLSFDYVEGESLLAGCQRLQISSGSACNSASRQPSYVLRALGRDDALAGSSLRISMGRFTTQAEVKEAVSLLRQEYMRLREVSPLWKKSSSSAG